MANFKKHFKKYTEGSWTQFKQSSTKLPEAGSSKGSMAGMAGVIGIGAGVTGLISALVAAPFLMAGLMFGAGITGIALNHISDTPQEDKIKDKEAFALSALFPLTIGAVAGIYSVTISAAIFGLAGRTTVALVKAPIDAIRDKTPAVQEKVLPAAPQEQAALPAPVADEFNLAQMPVMKITEPDEVLQISVKRVNKAKNISL